MKKSENWVKIVIFQTLASILWLLLIPKEAGNALILGYSLRRLALLVPLSLPLIIVLLLKQGSDKHQKWAAWLHEASNKHKAAVFMVAGGFLLAAITWGFVFFFHFMRFFPDLGAYIRLLPIMASYFLLGSEAILFVPLVLYPSKRESQMDRSPFSLKAYIIAFGILILGLVIMAVTGWGINPERVSIITLGTPLLEGQVWYATGMLALMMAAAYAWGCIPKEYRPVLRGKADLVIAFSIWLTAVVLWMSLPLPKNNYFAPPVQPPNYEVYPFSDAEQYDFNSLQVYYGSLKDIVISKPLYVTLLALFHAITGLRYDRIILLQSLLVAVFPVVLYFIGKELHSRIGGIAIAMFAILREITAIQATNMANVSNTKLLLSDMFAALLASLLVLVLIRWFKADGKKISGHEFILGGLIGAFILTRIQTLALVPFALIVIIIRFFRNLKSMAISAVILLIAVGLVITPVLLRNHAITGVYWVDNPSSSTALSRIMTQGLEIEEEIPIEALPDEPVQKNVSVIGLLLKNNLGDLLGFTADNFMRNEASALLMFPVRLGNHTPFLEYLTLTNPFFAEVYSQPNLPNLLVFLVNFAMIALGFSTAFRKLPWAVLAMVGFHIAYSLSSAVVRLSGWRFILPVDWVIYAFYAFGLVEGLIWLFRKTAGWNLTLQTPGLMDYLPEKQKTSRGWKIYVLFGMLFILIGGAIPLRENFLPPLTPEYSKSEVCKTIETEILDSEYVNLADSFSKYCAADSTQAFYGFGVYPRYFASGEGFYNRTYDPWFGKQPFARLVFRIIGTQNRKVYIKSENDVIRFSNGAKVYVVGDENAKFEAQVVFVEGEQPDLIISSEILSGQKLFEPINN
jgi:hypothetical protein